MFRLAVLTLQTNSFKLKQVNLLHPIYIYIYWKSLTSENQEQVTEAIITYTYTLITKNVWYMNYWGIKLRKPMENGSILDSEEQAISELSNKL